MGIPEADWKNQPNQILDWVIMSAGAGLLTIYLYLWWIEQLPQYLAIAAIFAAGGIIYFTDYWQPVLYLVLSILLIIFMSLWVVTGSWRQSYIQVVTTFNILFVSLCIYLFYKEDIHGSKKAQT